MMAVYSVYIKLHAFKLIFVSKLRKFFRILKTILIYLMNYTCLLKLGNKLSS